jgi:glycosyltransferase involved in cell wall biosynthesis
MSAAEAFALFWHGYASAIVREKRDHRRRASTSSASTPGPLESSRKLPNILATGPHALPEELLRRTEVLPPTEKIWWERVFAALRLSGLVQRSRQCRRAWAMFRKSRDFDAVVTDGALLGLTFAVLQRLRRPRRPIHVMYDCYWYGGNWLRRAFMRFCLRRVDLCVVWTRVECVRYAKTYGLTVDKFAFVKHHHTLNRYQFDVGDDGYIFTGGNSDRDYTLFLDAVRELSIPCILATNLPQLLSGLQIPTHVRVISASPAEFRQLMARARVVVVSMQANLLRTGGQQTFLNAMHMTKPVILTDPQGGSDYIEHGRTGLLVPYPDVPALRSAIRSVWENPENARVMGQHGREAALPLTTERCNTEIWNLALGLVASRRHMALMQGEVTSGSALNRSKQS